MYHYIRICAIIGYLSDLIYGVMKVGSYVSSLVMLLILQIHSLYRGTGASFQKAQSEFTSGVLRNESVRNAGAQMAANAAQGAMSSAASDNRY